MEESRVFVQPTPPQFFLAPSSTVGNSCQVSEDGRCINSDPTIPQPYAKVDCVFGITDGASLFTQAFDLATATDDSLVITDTVAGGTCPDGPCPGGTVTFRGTGGFFGLEVQASSKIEFKPAGRPTENFGFRICIGR